MPGFDSNQNTSCSFANIIAGINYAVANGARVLNISLGGPDPSPSIQTALINAAAQGAFISIAMGNEFEDGNTTSYPAAYAASIDGVMSVASIGFNSAKAFYSSTGPHCEIAAPGGDSRSGAGRLDRGLVWQSTLLGSDQSIPPRFDRYDKQSYQGTSMATPHVAGLAALLMSQMPTLTGAQVERILRATAKDLGTKGKDNSFGHGLIQPRAALFGYGISR
jgi:subtilisin family serine protease